MRLEHWGVVVRAFWHGTCINMIGPQAMVQVVEKLDETIDPGAAAQGRSRPWIIG
jgi:hypothetical protein